MKHHTSLTTGIFRRNPVRSGDGKDRYKLILFRVEISFIGSLVPDGRKLTLTFNSIAGVVMAFIQLQLQFSMICAGQFTLCVQNYQVEDPTETNAYRLAKDLADGWVSPTAGDSELDCLQNVMSEDSYVSSVRARRVTGGGSGYVRVFAVGDQQGLFSGTLASQQVAAYYKWVSAAQAGLYGGNFIPAVSEEALDANRFTDDYLIQADLYVACHLAGIAGVNDNFVPVIVKRKPLPVEYFPITGGQLALDAATMRRRLIPV
jgi:hypothetical protein